MFGYIDNSGKINQTSLASFYQGKQQSVSKIDSIHFQAILQKEEHQIPEALIQKKNLATYLSQQKKEKKAIPKTHVGQIMSQPVMTLFKDSSLKEAQELFHHKKFRHIPIITQEHKLTGIVSDRDMLSFYANNPKSSSEEQGIQEIMKSKVYFAKPEMEIHHVTNILIQKKIGCMPIVDNEHKVLGMITRSDMLKHFVSTFPLDIWI